jgi:hypothetical protein
MIVSTAASWCPKLYVIVPVIDNGQKISISEKRPLVNRVYFCKKRAFKFINKPHPKPRVFGKSCMAFPKSKISGISSL